MQDRVADLAAMASVPQRAGGPGAAGQPGWVGKAIWPRSHLPSARLTASLVRAGARLQQLRRWEENREPKQLWAGAGWSCAGRGAPESPDILEAPSAKDGRAGVPGAAWLSSSPAPGCRVAPLQKLCFSLVRGNPA